MKKLTKKLKTKHQERKQAKEDGDQPPKKIPNITNKTISEHRDEILGSGKKFTQPLQHSKHRIVIISTTIFILMIIGFFSYSTYALYRAQSTSFFMHRVTEVIPFPIARVGSTFVAYENYLFELRRYMHYYENQQQLDFNTESGQQQLAEFKRRALDKVVDYAYIQKLANEHDVTVSDQEIEEQIHLLRDQNRLGSGADVFEDVLQDYFGWTRNDFERHLRQELLTQKVIAELDEETNTRAQSALEELEAGEDFGQVAEAYSDDVTTRENNGEFGFWIDKNNRDMTPRATEALFSLEPSEHSDIVNTGYSLEIFKLLEAEEDRVRGAHILFNFQGINQHIDDLKEEKPAIVYIRNLE